MKTGRSSAPAADTGDLIATLRTLEPFSYRIAYYLLENRELACLAARTALLEAGRKPGLSGLSSRDLHALIKRLTIKSSLTLKAAVIHRDADC